MSINVDKFIAPITLAETANFFGCAKDLKTVCTRPTINPYSFVRPGMYRCESFNFSETSVIYRGYQIPKWSWLSVFNGLPSTSRQYYTTVHGGGLEVTMYRMIIPATNATVIATLRAFLNAEITQISGGGSFPYKAYSLSEFNGYNHSVRPNLTNSVYVQYSEQDILINDDPRYTGWYEMLQGRYLGNTLRYSVMSPNLTSGEGVSLASIFGENDYNKPANQVSVLGTYNDPSRNVHLYPKWAVMFVSGNPIGISSGLSSERNHALVYVFITNQLMTSGGMSGIPLCDIFGMDYSRIFDSDIIGFLDDDINTAFSWGFKENEMLYMMPVLNCSGAGINGTGHVMSMNFPHADLGIRQTYASFVSNSDIRATHIQGVLVCTHEDDPDQYVLTIDDCIVTFGGAQDAQIIIYDMHIERSGYQDIHSSYNVNTYMNGQTSRNVGASLTTTIVQSRPNVGAIVDVLIYLHYRKCSSQQAQDVILWPVSISVTVPAVAGTVRYSFNTTINQ